MQPHPALRRACVAHARMQANVHGQQLACSRQARTLPPPIHPGPLQVSVYSLATEKRVRSLPLDRSYTAAVAAVDVAFR